MRFVKRELLAEQARDAGIVEMLNHGADHWATIVEAILWKCGAERIDPSVGGRTSSIVLTADGSKSSSLFALDAKATEKGAERITLDKDDVERFYKHGLRQRMSKHRNKWKFIPPVERRS